MFSFLLLVRTFVKTLYRAVRDEPAIRGMLVLTAFMLLIGTIFYSRMEHWSALNALYFSVTTLTTVGYGDFSPHRPITKMFTIMFILIGVGILLGLVNLLAEHAIRVQQARINNRRNRRDKTKT